MSPRTTKANGAKAGKAASGQEAARRHAMLVDRLIGREMSRMWSGVEASALPDVFRAEADGVTAVVSWDAVFGWVVQFRHAEGAEGVAHCAGAWDLLVRLEGFEFLGGAR